MPPLRVEWADTKGEGTCNSDVKSLHVSNFPEDTTEESLKEAFAELGPLERVALLDRKNDRGGSEPGKKRDYAFIHYEKRSTMLKVFEVRFRTNRLIDFRVFVSGVSAFFGNSKRYDLLNQYILCPDG